MGLTPKRDNQTHVPEGHQKPIGRPLFFACISVTVICTVVIIILSLNNVPTEPFGHAPRVLILLMLAIVVTASLAVTKIIPWRSLSFLEWQQPQVLGSFVGLIFGSLGLVVGLATVFNPPGATEKTVEEIRDALEKGGIAKGQSSLVEKNIAGVWGEPGCQVTYQIRLDLGLLKIDSQKSALGQRPLVMELAAESGQARRLVASVIEPVGERGDQHEFVYERHGTREFLTWIIKKREISLKLDRCSGE